LSNRDWSLVLFTTLAQWSVGIILCFTWPVVVNHGMSGIFETGLTLRNPILLSLIFISIATFSSLLHLGNPKNAARALNNLSGSWLSREILAIGVFTACLVFILLLGWKTSNFEYLNYLMVLGSLIGLALLWTMTRIYVIPTIPAWNSWYTPVSFVSTAFSLGLLTLLVLNVNSVMSIAGHIDRSAPIALAVMLLIEMLSGIAHQSKLGKLDTGMNKLVFNRGIYYRVFLFRVALLVIALVMLLIVIGNTNIFAATHLDTWSFVLLSLVVVQELTGRLLFYSSYFRIGV